MEKYSTLFCAIANAKPRHIIYLFVLFTILSCSRKFDITNHFDPAQSFQVVDLEKSANSESVIQVNDLKHDQLISWLELNSRNWKPTDVSYASLFMLSQEKFKLLLYRNSDFVVIIFTDEKNNSHQIKKVIDRNTLKFLDEE